MTLRQPDFHQIAKITIITVSGDGKPNINVHGKEVLEKEYCVAVLTSEVAKHTGETCSCGFFVRT